MFGTALFHLATGVVLALVYALIAHERLRGPGWLRGIVFAQLPGAIQLLTILPHLGHGIGGWRLSPATPFLSWSLNALYGAILGEVVTILINGRSP